MHISELEYVNQALFAGRYMSKVASEVSEVSSHAGESACMVAVELVDRLKTSAASPDALAVVDYVLSLRDLQESTGTKLSADSTLLTDAVSKLATALVVDEALVMKIANCTTLPQKEAAMQERNLGREYIAELSRLILS